MADFPVSKHTFATFANGATSDAAQVTDIYAEVEAIEDGYLNGTARLNSSNSTMVALSVTGTSTFAGAVTFGSIVSMTVAASTFTTRPVMPAPDVAIVTGSTSQFGNNSSGGVSWPTETTLLNSSIHSTSANADRFVPQTTGVYCLSASLKFQAGLTNGSTMNVAAYIKDSSGGLMEFVRVGAAGDAAPTLSLMGLKRFDVVGGHLRAVVLQRTGSTQSLDGVFSFARFWKL